MLYGPNDHIPLTSHKDIGTLQIRLSEINNFLNQMHRFLYDVRRVARHAVGISQLLYLTSRMLQSLLYSAVVPHHLVHPALELLVAAVHDLLLLTADAVNETRKVIFERSGCLVPTLLDNHPPVISPSLYYLQVVDVLSAFQLSQRQLLVHAFQTLRKGLQHVRPVFLASRTGDTEQRVLASQANHRQLLVGMDRTVGLRQLVLRTVAFRVEPSAANRCQFLYRFLVSLILFSSSVDILRLCSSFLPILFFSHQRYQHLIRELVDAPQLILPQLHRLFATYAAGLRNSVDVELIFMIAEGETAQTEAMTAIEVDNWRSLFALLTLALPTLISLSFHNVVIISFMRLSRKLAFRMAVQIQDRIVFFGSGRVALPSLKMLSQNHPNIQIVTQSSHNQKKNFNQVEKYCREKQLTWSAPITAKTDKQKRKDEWTTFLQNLGPVDFGVVCSYGYMLPIRLINRFSKGLVVVHPSLLPKYRGGAPIFHAIANGDKVSGVSYIQISKGTFDQGNILHQVEVPIDATSTYSDIQQTLAEEAAKSLPYLIQNIDSLRPGVPQNTMTIDFPKEQLLAPLVLTTKLDINRPAQVVYNWSRALQTAKVRLVAKDKDIILKLNSQYLQEDGEIGTFKVVGKRLYLRCADKFIRVNKWYEAGHKEQPPGIFIAQFIKSGKYPAQSVRVE